jgi:tetratricopeptide (TPR) repeat protein
MRMRELEDLTRQTQPGGSVSVRAALRAMYLTRALILTELGEHQDALTYWDRVLAMADMADGFSITQYQIFRALTLAKLGDYGQATQEVDRATGPPVKEASILYNAASVYSLSVALVHADAKRSTEERNALGEQYAARAVALLRRAQAAGFFADPAQINQVTTDNDLHPLRSHPDFQKFLAEVTSPERPAAPAP